MNYQSFFFSMKRGISDEIIDYSTIPSSDPIGPNYTMKIKRLMIVPNYRDIYRKLLKRIFRTVFYSIRIFNIITANRTKTR